MEVVKSPEEMLEVALDLVSVLTVTNKKEQSVH